MTSAEAHELATFSLLDGHQYMNLTTTREDGTQATRPVWFAREGDSVYALTYAKSHKVAHIRNNPEVFVAPADGRGTPLSELRAPGTATIYEKDHPTAKKANSALNRKYGLLKQLFALNYWLRGAKGVWLEIKPR